MSRSHMLLIIGFSLAGCTAAKSTYHLAEAEQEIYLGRDTEAPSKAVYEWTKAEEYLAKAREEWGYADYGPAEDYARKAAEAANQAEQVAKAAGRRDMTENMGDLVPEDIERHDDKDQMEIFNREEKLDVEGIEEEEEDPDEED